jgi:hypothetical protein
MKLSSRGVAVAGSAVDSRSEAVDPVANGGVRGSAPRRSRFRQVRTIESLPPGGGRLPPRPAADDERLVGCLDLLERLALPGQRVPPPGERLARPADPHPGPARPLRIAGQALEAADLVGRSERRRPAVRLALRQEVPGEDGELAGDGHDRGPGAAPGPDPDVEAPQRARRPDDSMGGLDEEAPGMTLRRPPSDRDPLNRDRRRPSPGQLRLGRRRDE